METIVFRSRFRHKRSGASVGEKFVVVFKPSQNAVPEFVENQRLFSNVGKRSELSGAYYHGGAIVLTSKTLPAAFVARLKKHEESFRQGLSIA